MRLDAPAATQQGRFGEDGDGKVYQHNEAI